MAFQIKDAHKAEGDLIKILFDRKKGHYKSLQMVQRSSLLTKYGRSGKQITERRRERRGKVGEA
jgi:hypothetical protein